MTAGPPQQRQYPGEGAGKCNPERDARPPMFPNQADPPPQRPWPATADEGNSVPAPAVPRPAGDPGGDDGAQPWTVLVEGGQVVGVYRAQDALRGGIDVTRTRLEDVAMYEIRVREGQTPRVGETVDPAAAGWARVG